MPAKSAPKKKLSVLKRVRQSENQRLRNQSIESRIKTYVTKLQKALPAKNKDEIEVLLRDTIKVISSAASKGVIHKNTASRKISRITKNVNVAIAQG